MPIDSRVVRDYQGNVRTVRRFGDAVVERAALTDPLTPLDVQPVGMSGYADPVFSDEFQAAELDTSKWLPCYPDTDYWNTTVPGGHLSNTDEPQGYDPSGITFDDDGMVLTLREEETVPGLAYTSGMVTSYPSFNPVHGFFEARMMLADVQDAWPAFWMMPTGQVRHPEFDVVENDGKDAFNNQTYHTLHRADGSTSTPFGYAQDVGSQWRTFGLLWEAERLRWYVDGELVKDETFEAADPMYLICNLAGRKDSAPVAPFSVHVAHIRAWALPA